MLNELHIWSSEMHNKQCVWIIVIIVFLTIVFCILLTMAVCQSPARLILNLYWIVPWVLIYCKVIIGSGNGLAPNMQQTKAEPSAPKEFPWHFQHGFSVKARKDISMVHKSARMIINADNQCYTITLVVTSPELAIISILRFLYPW